MPPRLRASPRDFPSRPPYRRARHRGGIGMTSFVVTFDAKGKMSLPPVPTTRGDLCAWLTTVFALDPAHAITGGEHYGRATGQVILGRHDAAAFHFEPASRINNPPRLIEDLAWQTI